MQPTVKKVLGPKAPCTPGKYHSVGVGSGVCSNCDKQIHKPDPKRLASLMGVSRQVTKQVFTS